MTDEKFPEWNTEEYLETATVESVIEYLYAGAKINAKTRDKDTPLHYAAWLNTNPQVIKLLIAAGAKVNAKDKDGWTPLIRAALRNTPEVIETLLKAGADPTHQDCKGRTAWDFAHNNEVLINTDAYYSLKPIAKERKL